MHELPYTLEGRPALVAIDSRGDERKRVKLLPGVSYERAKAWLEQLLDNVDPVRKIELVRETPTQRPRPDPKKPHPAHANDFHAYRRRLITQVSHRVRLFRDED